MQKSSVEFFANGKIILTAEYFVLYGAKALALPVKFGQSLSVIPPILCHSAPKNLKEESVRIDHSIFSWQSFYRDQLWFSAEFNSGDFSIQKTSDRAIAETLILLLKTAHELNSEFGIDPGILVKTVLDFSPQWGLGSSSTLVANLAAWAKVDPFVLNEEVFHGSGFDIACTRANGPILYVKGQAAKPVEVNYPFAENLYLVYSGRKKGTREAITGKNFRVSEAMKNEISALTEQFSICKKLNDFQDLIKIHEQKTAFLIGQVPVQERLFSGFGGAIKSLGAWGGDFLLAASEWNFNRVKSYFAEKGMTKILKWEEMVLQKCHGF